MMQPGYVQHGFKYYLGILPGWEWLREHEHDLDGWQPTFELSRPGFTSTSHIKDLTVVKEVIKEVLK